MTIELTPAMEAIVTARLSTGRYGSADAVVEEALRSLQSARQTPPLNSEEASTERAQRIRQLFEEIEAAGGLELQLDRDTRPAEEREAW